MCLVELKIIDSKIKFQYTKRGTSLLFPSNLTECIFVGKTGIQINQENIKAQPLDQRIVKYEVALGTDRRFAKTRDDTVPFTDVGLNKSVTFFDLSLTPEAGRYYFTVRAYSSSYSMVEVSSNGFYVGFNGGVTGMYESYRKSRGGVEGILIPNFLDIKRRFLNLKN